MAIGVFMPMATGVVAPVEATFLGGQSITSSSSTINFSAVSVPEPGLLVVMAARYRTSSVNGAITSLTLDGETISNQLPATSAHQSIGAASKRIASAKSVSVSLTMNNGPTGAAIGVWLLKNVMGDVPVATGDVTDNSASSFDQINLDVPHGGFVTLGHVHWSTGATTWTSGVTQRYNVTGGSQVRFGMADYSATTEEAGKEFRASFTNENSATAGVVWR